jgi:hypothetical protein
MKKAIIKKSSPVDMVYEGISKQENALKELRAKRIAGKAKMRGAKFKGGLYAGRYSE